MYVCMYVQYSVSSVNQLQPGASLLLVLWFIM